MAPRPEFYPFRYRDPRTGKWVRARYVAELHEIAARHTEFEITGPAEISEVNPAARSFAPHRPNVNNLGPALTIIRKTARLAPILGVAT